METGNSGIIGYTETRSNINAMKEYYREEYKKIVDKEKKSDSDLFHNKCCLLIQYWHLSYLSL